MTKVAIAKAAAAPLTKIDAPEERAKGNYVIAGGD